MTECPAIAVYICIEDEAPKAYDFIAYLVPGGKPLPMRFRGLTSDLARQAARDWWTEQQEIEARKVENLDRLRAARKTKAAA